MNPALSDAVVPSIVERAVEIAACSPADVPGSQYFAQPFYNLSIIPLLLLIVIFAWIARPSAGKEQRRENEKEESQASAHKEACSKCGRDRRRTNGEDHKNVGVAKANIQAEAVPRTLLISGYPERVDGTYKLQDRRKNGREVWEQTTETQRLVLYCMKDGHWGVTKAALIDDGNRGFICSEETAMRFPHEQRWGMKRNGQLRFVGNIHVKVVEEAAEQIQKDSEAEEVAQLGNEEFRQQQAEVEDVVQREPDGGSSIFMKPSIPITCHMMKNCANLMRPDA